MLLTALTAAFAIIHAQQANNGLRVSPTNFNLNLTPGQATTNTITVDNMTDQTVDIQTLLRNFTAQGEEGGVNLTAQDTTFSLADWITVTPQSAVIAPGDSQAFTFTINPPLNAEPGGHFGSIVFATIPPPSAKGVGAALSEQIASLILAEIPGNVKEQASVISFTTDKNFYEFGPVNFIARVENTGSVHIQPSGEVEVTGMFGQHFDVPVENLNILPDAVRQIPSVLNKHFLFGKYDAYFIGVYGTKNQQLSASTQFYAFPLRYGLIILIVFLLLFLFRKRLGKALKTILTGK
jgi:P pilus assembly chaperone PapD